MKKNCRLRSCSQDKRSGRIISPCPPGFTCKIKIPGIPEQNIPAVGECVPVTFTSKLIDDNNAFEEQDAHIFKARPKLDRITLHTILFFFLS